MCDVQMLEENDVEIPEDLKDQDELQANIWVCNGKLLRMVLNPFKPARYLICQHHMNLIHIHSLVGIAENMDDTQTLMNGFMRMAVDNAVLSGNLIMEVDETNLVPDRTYLYIRESVRRQVEHRQAIFGKSFQMYQMKTYSYLIKQDN